jgi:hypothetical protein
VDCNESGRWRIYPSDEFGFPNPRKLWQLDKIDVLAVGDSYTHGACVPFGKSFVAEIRKTFPATLGVGAGGNGPLAELASIREYAAFMQPQYVVWFYFENDLQQDLAREKRHPLLVRYLDRSFRQELFHRQPEIDKHIKSLVKTHMLEASQSATRSSDNEFKFRDLLDFSDTVNPLTRLPGLTLALTRRRLGLTYGGGEWPKPDAETFHRTLAIARDEVAEWGGLLVMVQLADWDSVVLGDRRKDIYYDTARAVAEDLGLPVIDLRTVFRNHPDPRSLWPNRSPGHYGEQGHALVGSVVVEALLALQSH